MTGGIAADLAHVAIEGAVDRFCGRPRNRNPYADATDEFEAWAWGWDDADYLLEIRGQKEAARWLSEAAA